MAKGRAKRGKNKKLAGAKLRGLDPNPRGGDFQVAGSRIHLKPVFRFCDRVFANDHGYGTVQSCDKVAPMAETTSPYGPKLVYKILWDSTNEILRLEDHLLSSEFDHKLSLRAKSEGKLIGVKNVLDRSCRDKWARQVGWWVANIDGKERPFPLLADAIEAYDKSVVKNWEKKKGKGRKKLKEAELNLPEDWPHIFNSKIGTSKNGKRAESSQKQERYNVYVKCPDGEMAEVESFGSQTIGAFKDTMRNTYGRASATTKMTFEGRELEDDKCLSHYNIESDCLLTAQMQIYVGFLSTKGFLLDVDPSVTIAEVKAMIESKENEFPMLLQRIFSERNNLENEMTLSQCNISDGDNLFVLVREDAQSPKEGCIQIYVKFDEKVLTLDVAPTDTLTSVKRMLFKQEDVLPDFQRLSFGGRYLENSSDTLWDCGISSECLLHLIMSQEPESGCMLAYHVDHEIDSQDVDQSTQGDIQSQDDEKITIYLMNPAVQTDGIPYVTNKDAPLGQIFSDYASRVNIPSSNLEFVYGEYGELPSDCEFSAEALAVSDGDTILVNSTAAPSFVPQILNEDRYGTADCNSILDLTRFSTGSNSIIVNLQGIGEETKVKIDRNSTSLQLIFDAFADRKNVDPASLTYVCDARRFSHEADETAAQGGIDNGNTIHVLEKNYSSKTNSNPRMGKIIINLLEIGHTENEKEFFRVDVNVRLQRIFKSYATRINIDLGKLRFLYQGINLHVDSDDGTTAAHLGIEDGGIVCVLKKKDKPSMCLTPNAIKTLQQMPRDRIFEPVVQVIKINRANMELTISDGTNFLTLPFHARLTPQIESGAISRFAIIWAIELKKFSLLDADKAASNPGKIIGAPTEMHIAPNTPNLPCKLLNAAIATGNNKRKTRRLENGLPWLITCHSETCSKVSDNLKMCSRCHFVGYCSAECQTESWNAKHNSECRYYEAYYEFIKNTEDDDDLELADIFSFWSDQQERMGPSKPLTNDVAASICNSSLYCASNLLEADMHPLMAKAYILNAAFLRQCCSPGTPIEDMVEWYEIGSEGVALNRFFSRVPLLKTGHDAISSKASMLAYLKANHAHDERIAGSTSLDGRVLESEVLVNEKTSKHKIPSGKYVRDWGESHHIFKLPRGEGSHIRRKWVSRTSRRENCYEDHSLGRKFYCPQVGDLLVYIPRAHYDTLQQYPVNGYSYPWKSWPTDVPWPVVRCVVTHIRYRFPYKKCYKSRSPDCNLQGVAAIVKLEITGVPSQSSRLFFHWPTPSFVPPLTKHCFEVTVFESDEETFIIPEFLYSWRIIQLERAIKSNNFEAHGLCVTIYFPFSYDDDVEDEEYGAYPSPVKNIFREEKETELHFTDSGYNSIESYDSIHSTWCVTEQSALVSSLAIPKISADAMNAIQIWFQKVLLLDPKIKKWFFDLDTSKYVDYLDMVEVPMDLSLIQKRLRNNYYTNKYGVLGDMELIKENCYKYHKDGNEVYETASLMYKSLKSLLESFIEEGQVLLEFASKQGNNHSKEREMIQFHHELSSDLVPLLHAYSIEYGILLDFLHFTYDQTVIYPNSRRNQNPSGLGMISKGKYVIHVSTLSAKERHSQEIIANFVQYRHRLRKVRRVVARNAIARFIWRCHERQARKLIANFIWRRIALQRRQKLRIGAVLIQKVHRGHYTRKLYGGPLQIRLKEFRQFSSIWKQTVQQFPTSVQPLAGWALERERINVKKMEFMDDEGNLAGTDEKLSKALVGALNEAEAVEPEEEEIESESEHLAAEENSRCTEEQLANLDWSQFQVTAHVVKWMRTGDAKYRELFVKKMKQLAKGERSHKLQKPLKGCKSIIYESYLENKSGFRILWTQENSRIVVWFVAKHKNVSRLAKLIDDAKHRTARQKLPDSFISELENGNAPSQEKKEILLDALGNVPLKLYDVSFDNVDDITEKSWSPQMHLTEEERKVVEAKGTVLLLGRSGTGKTVCICNRIEFDRQMLGHKPNFSQLFVARSSQLCRYVKDAVGNIEGSSFTTFDRLVGHLLESPLSGIISKSFHQRHYVNFARFNQDFYSSRFPQEEVNALIVWKAIRTFLKGSIEAFQTPTGLLSREYFIHPKKLGKNRCKVPLEIRNFVYEIFLQYQLWMDAGHLWDDCDRIIALLKGLEHAKKSNPSIYADQIKKSKLYVDEVQDYTQLEILMFFYIGGGPGALFLAGDPAQSVVEGTDFRFEEVRSVGYFVAGNGRCHLIPEKPKIVNVNFRSHAGVLNCAGGFLDLLFGYFPGSAKQLKKDFGLFKGARPGVFPNVKTQQLSTLLKEKMPGAVVLTHDESTSRWKDLLGHKLVYGIREAKGMEFKSVIVLDFFAELPLSVQKPWRNLLLNRVLLKGSDFESRFPLVETHLKLVYTAVTRCIEQLFFAETHSSVAGDAAVRWLTTTTNDKDEANNEALATINNVTDLESMTMTNDEFCVVGIDNAELALFSEVDLQQSLKYLDRAIYCFQEAQSTDLVAKAQAHLASVQFRQKFNQMDPPMTQNYKESVEREAAQMMESLLRENLLMECVNLIRSLAPVLSSYAQQKLDEYITLGMRHI